MHKVTFMNTLSIWQTDTGFLLKKEYFSCILYEEPWKNKNLACKLWKNRLYHQLGIYLCNSVV
jgi:hypothetical protein